MILKFKQEHEINEKMKHIRGKSTSVVTCGIPREHMPEEIDRRHHPDLPPTRVVGLALRMHLVLGGQLLWVNKARWPLLVRCERHHAVAVNGTHHEPPVANHEKRLSVALPHLALVQIAPAPGPARALVLERLTEIRQPLRIVGLWTKHTASVMIFLCSSERGSGSFRVERLVLEAIL